MSTSQKEKDSCCSKTCCSKIFSVSIKTAGFLAAFAALGLAINNYFETNKLKTTCVREVMPCSMDIEDRVSNLEQMVLQKFTQLDESIRSLSSRMDEKNDAFRNELDILERMIDQQYIVPEGFSQLDSRFNESIRSLTSIVNERDDAIRTQVDMLSDTLIGLRAEVNMNTRDTEERVRNLETALQTTMDRQDMVVQGLAQLDTRFNESIRLLSLRVDERDNAISAQIDTISDSLTSLRADVNVNVRVVNAKFNTFNRTVLSTDSRLNSITTSFEARLGNLDSYLTGQIRGTNNRINFYHSTSSNMFPRPGVASAFMTVVTAYLTVYGVVLG